MLCVPFIKCSCTKCEALLVSFLYTTLPKLKPKTQPHAAECFYRIRVTQMVKKCTSFHPDRGFIIVFRTVRHRTTLRLIEPVTHNSHLVLCLRGDRGSTVVKVLCYKSEGRWFDPSRCHWNFSLT